MRPGPLAPALAARIAALPAGPKLLALAALGTGLLLLQALPVLAAFAALGSGLGLLALGPRRLRDGFPTALVIAIAALALFTLAFEGGQPALAVVLRLVALVAFAHLVTATTRASAVQDALVAGLRPFERLPFVSAEKTGLALAITLRSLPRLAASLAELREAQAARGLAVSPLRLLVPLVARTLRDARDVADAIDARSWGAEKRTTDP